MVGPESERAKTDDGPKQTISGVKTPKLKERSPIGPVLALDGREITTLVAEERGRILFLLDDNGRVIILEPEIGVDSILLFTSPRTLITVGELVPRSLVETSLVVDTAIALPVLLVPRSTKETGSFSPARPRLVSL